MLTVTMINPRLRKTETRFFGETSNLSTGNSEGRGMLSLRPPGGRVVSSLKTGQSINKPDLALNN